MERQVDVDDAGDDRSRPPDDSGSAGAASVVGPEPVRMTLPAKGRYVRVARLVASGLANELGFGVDRLDDVRLAVGEACALAVQLGATSISLAYALDDHSLGVSIEAQFDGQSDDPDNEYLALVEQVLAVAASDHQIDRQDRQMSIRVLFTDGS